MQRSIKGYLTFIREAKSRFQTTGALLPSGKQLSRATIKPYLKVDRPVRILEVGPGTGPVTLEVAKNLKPNDVFHIVELNDHFVGHLKQRFETENVFRRVQSQMQLHHLSIQDYKPDAPYDFIMCGLPFNNFPLPLVKDIFHQFTELLAPNGVLSFFEYLWIRRFKALVAARHERQRLSEVGSVLTWYVDKYEFDYTRAFVNFPPAVVHHLRLHSNQTDPADDHVAA